MGGVPGAIDTNLELPSGKRRGRAMRKIVFNLGAVLISVFSLMAFAADCEAQSKISSGASINLLDPSLLQHVDSSDQPNSSTHAEAASTSAFGSAVAKSDANTNSVLAAFAQTQNVGLMHPSQSNSLYKSSFYISGNPKRYELPLTFTYSVDAKMFVRTGRLGVGFATARYDFYNGNRGSFIYAEQYGWPVLLQRTGAFARGAAGTSRVDIRPIITLDIDVPVSEKESIPITTDDLNYLDIALPVDISNADDLHVIADLIALKIFDLGLPRISLAPRVKVDVGFDLTWHFSVKPKMTGQYESMGRIMLFILVEAKTTVDASSDTSFTMSLKSVTLPSDYTEVDPNNLAIVFDSGLTMNVTREELPPRSNP
jgi:hypothetical protein